MRTSKMVFAGLTIAAAVATGSAFTASNDVTAVHDQSAGYGQVAVSGITVTNIAYTPKAADATYLDHVTFTSSGLDEDQQTATLTLKSSSTTVLGTPYACTIDDATTITCSVASGNVLFTAFSNVGLTVVHESTDSLT